MNNKYLKKEGAKIHFLLDLCRFFCFLVRLTDRNRENRERSGLECVLLETIPENIPTNSGFSGNYETPVLL